MSGDAERREVVAGVIGEVAKWLPRFDCLVIGPGLGRDPLLTVSPLLLPQNAHGGCFGAAEWQNRDRAIEKNGRMAEWQNGRSYFPFPESIATSAFIERAVGRAHVAQLASPACLVCSPGVRD